MKTQAILTEIRADGMQKWEREELPVSDHNRYIWLAPFQSKLDLSVGVVMTLEFVKGTGGPTGGHWAYWKVV